MRLDKSVSHKDYTIKAVTTDWVDAFVKYREIVFEETNKNEHCLSKETAEWFIDSYTKPTRFGLLLVKGEEVVGELFLTSVDKQALPIVSNFYVLKDHRLKGLGRVMFGVMEVALQRGGYKGVSVFRDGITDEFFLKGGYRKPSIKEAFGFLVKNLSNASVSVTKLSRLKL